MEGTSGGGGGGMGNGGGGLARFRSAPVTWLDALLEEDLTREAGSSSGGGLTQLLTATPPAAADPGFFQRQNSSPADFATPDAYFSSFPVSGNYDFLAPSQPTAPNKRSRDTDLPSPSDFHHHLKGEPSSLLDLDMDKLLEDSVPCRLRAKRGCATHPRSIAERVRRTRISDRIRKLQELVPNMDKQTNTADMLEEAVEYVKRLQEQIEELTELQKNCTCMAKE